MTAMRLQRALARAGVASRRAAEDLIRDGRVKVNGEVAHLGMSVDPSSDAIVVGRRRVRLEDPQWLVLNKPVGYVVTKRDDRGRRTVFELVPETRGLTYVGRLDLMTEGLVLLTTDGSAVHRLTHPKYEVERTYRATVRGRSAAEIRKVLARPIVIDERPVAIVRCTVRDEKGQSEIELVLTEGRYRIVRRLCDSLGLEVLRLVRTRHGPVGLGTLAVGKWRHLTRKERRALDALCASPA